MTEFASCQLNRPSASLLKSLLCRHYGKDFMNSHCIRGRPWSNPRFYALFIFINHNLHNFNWLGVGTIPQPTKLTPTYTVGVRRVRNAAITAQYSPKKESYYLLTLVFSTPHLGWFLISQSFSVTSNKVCIQNMWSVFCYINSLAYNHRGWYQDRIFLTWRLSDNKPVESACQNPWDWGTLCSQTL